MKICMSLLIAATLVPSAAFAAGADTPAKLDSRLEAATTVLHQLSAVPDKGIPDRIARKARCVIVVPGFKKGAFIGGAQYGQGMATCFDTNKGWSAPVFVQMAGASFGLQIGGQSTDLVSGRCNQAERDRSAQGQGEAGWRCFGGRWPGRARLTGRHHRNCQCGVPDLLAEQRAFCGCRSRGR